MVHFDRARGTAKRLSALTKSPSSWSRRAVRERSCYNSRMINTLTVRNFGCLKDVTADLTRVHAFIGPNDSGKSTLLRAVRTLSQIATLKFSAGAYGWEPFDPGFAAFPIDLPIELAATTPAGTHRAIFEKGQLYEEGEKGGQKSARRHRNWEMKAPKDAWPDLRHSVGRAALVRFDPDALRCPSLLIPEGEEIRFVDDRGAGLPGIYQAILSRGDETFTLISKDIQKHFPNVRYLRVPAISQDELALEVELRDGTRVRASQFSEGLLLYLAFAAVRWTAGIDTLLVKDPENGLHPSRIHDVMAMLRAFSKEAPAQVLIATHSPLVVNEMEPDEATVVTRTIGEGTRLTPISKTPNFVKRSSVYALGELWLSYADGRLESALLDSARE